MVTAREVAQLCGVSVATVSRVFNRPATVSATTRERVERVARDLDFSPNESARALSRQQSAMVGLVWDTDHRRPGWRHPFLQDLLLGLKSALSSHGYHLLLLATSDDARDRHPGVSLADPIAYVSMTRRHHLAGDLGQPGLQLDDASLRKHRRYSGRPRLGPRILSASRRARTAATLAPAAPRIFREMLG